MAILTAICMLALLGYFSASAETAGWGTSGLHEQCDRTLQRRNGPAGMTLESQRCLQRLRKNITDSLHPFIQDFPGKIALFDVATHSNVGDNLLWKGAMDMMFMAIRSPDLLCSHAQANKRMQGHHFPICGSAAATMERLGSPALILWQAGGNFGDLWTFVQYYRMQMIQEFEHTIETDERFRGFNLTILQLPQSVFYTDKSVMEREAGILRNLKHINFILATRATSSYMIAVNEMKLPKVLAIPDIACASGPFIGTVPPVVDIVLLPRSDREAMLTPETAEAIVKRAAEAAGLTYKVTAYAAEFDDSVNKPQPLYSSLSSVRAASGIGIITQGQVVITNLMHTSVMSILSGRPVFFWDGGVQVGYNKVGGMFNMMKSASSCSEESLGAFYFASANETDDLVRATNAAVAYVLKMPCFSS